MFNNKKILAIIPARCGSKRLPNKNILNLNGKPLIYWTINEAIKSKYIDSVLVSTDDTKIANISKEFGAYVPFIRPRELALDTSKSIEVINHAVNYLKKEKRYFDFVILLQPTSPLRIVDDIDNAFFLLDENVKAVISVCECEHPPMWSNTLPDNLNMKDFIRPEIKNIRSQDMPKSYRLNGAIFLSEVGYVLKNNGFFGDKTKALIMPQNRSVDIDSKIDFDISQILLKNIQKL